MAVSVGSVKGGCVPRRTHPTTELHAVGADHLVVGVALEERVRLDLVHGRGHVVVLDEVDEAVGVEVGDTDRPGVAIGVDLLHRPPGAVVVAEGLVDLVAAELTTSRRARPSQVAGIPVVDRDRTLLFVGLSDTARGVW